MLLAEPVIHFTWHWLDAWLDALRKSKIIVMDSNGRWFMSDNRERLHLVRWSCVKGAKEHNLTFHMVKPSTATSWRFDLMCYLDFVVDLWILFLIVFGGFCFVEWILFLILLCGFYGFSCVDLWILFCLSWILWILLCGFMDSIFEVVLWSWWIFVWCCNSGDGFAPWWRDPPFETVVAEDDRAEDDVTFPMACNRRWPRYGRMVHLLWWKWLSHLRGVLSRVVTEPGCDWAGLWILLHLLTCTGVFAPNGVSTCHWLNKSKLCTHAHWKTSAERMFVIDHVELSLTMFACALLFMFCLSCFGQCFCFSLVSHWHVLTWIWQLRFDGVFLVCDASGRWHGEKGLLRVSVHAVSVHTVVDDDWLSLTIINIESKMSKFKT